MQAQREVDNRSNSNSSSISNSGNDHCRDGDASLIGFHADMDMFNSHHSLLCSTSAPSSTSMTSATSPPPSKIRRVISDTRISPTSTKAAPFAPFHNHHNAASPIKFRKYQADQWEARYHELIQYRETHGHCLVDSNTDRTLSHWIKRQRCQYKLKQDGNHTTLTDERQSKLESLGFVWDSHEVAWEYRYQDLLAFKARTGHTNVPTVYSNNPSLGIWVKGQRRQYRLHSSGQRSTLTAKRINRLRDIDFQWVSPSMMNRAPFPARVGLAA
mmetsp:Transcript_22051/g.61356  ORF Transcript_22051/g.61356 Transcript_22051/m.61356 type:complete len:271 (-) Transcript_22051:1082-1894(-)